MWSRGCTAALLAALVSAMATSDAQLSNSVHYVVRIPQLQVGTSCFIPGVSTGRLSLAMCCKQEKSSNSEQGTVVSSAVSSGAFCNQMQLGSGPGDGRNTRHLLCHVVTGSELTNSGPCFLRLI